jgi:hypothetical protein
VLRVVRECRWQARTGQDKSGGERRVEEAKSGWVEAEERKRSREGDVGAVTTEGAREKREDGEVSRSGLKAGGSVSGVRGRTAGT